MNTNKDFKTSKEEFKTLCVHFAFSIMFLFFVNTFTFQFTYHPWFLYPAISFVLILFFKYLDLKKMRDAEMRGSRFGLPSGRNRRRLELLDEREFKTLYNERDLV